jgi:hypothetical protein
MTFIGLTGQCSRIEGFQVAILVHVLSILRGKRGIKCTCNTATRAAFMGKIMNRVSWYLFFFYSKQRRFRFELGILPKFNVVL